MHLCVEAVGIKHSGGAAVLQSFLNAAVSDERVSKITVICSLRSARNFDLPRSEKLIEIEKRLAEKNRAYRVWWLRRGLPSEVSRIGADVLFCFTGAGIGPPSVPHVTFVQQAVPYSREALLRSGWVGRLRAAWIRRVTRRSCSSSRKILVQTASMRDLLADTLGIDRGRMEVISPWIDPFPPGDGDDPRVDAMLATPEGLRLLYVGNTSSYKNVGVAVSAMGRVRQDLAGATLFLTWPQSHPVCRSPGVVGLGYLDSGILRKAYELATVLVMPSLVESAGLPMLEAMTLGIPVLAADRPYARDICHDAAVYFDPQDPADLAEKTLQLLRDDGQRRELTMKGRARIQEIEQSRPPQRMVDALVEQASRP